MFQIFDQIQRNAQIILASLELFEKINVELYNKKITHPNLERKNCSNGGDKKVIREIDAEYYSEIQCLLRVSEVSTSQEKIKKIKRTLRYFLRLSE